MINKLKQLLVSLFKPKPKNKTPGGPKIGLVSVAVFKDGTPVELHLTPDGTIDLSPPVPLPPSNEEMFLSSNDFTPGSDTTPTWKSPVGVGPKVKKKKKTKKQTTEQNAIVMVELLKWTTYVTAIQFQKSCQIRRDRFLPLLKKLVKSGKIIRFGTGKSGDPYRYRLPGKHGQ